MDESARQNLIEAIRKVMEAEYSDDAEMNRLVSFIEASVPDPYVCDYMAVETNDLTHPRPFWNGRWHIVPLRCPPLVKDGGRRALDFHWLDCLTRFEIVEVIMPVMGDAKLVRQRKELLGL